MSEPNYDEERVPHYELPDVLAMRDGQRVRDARMWYTQRRPEVLELFREHVYGRAPARPERVSYELLENGTPALEGRAIRRQVRIRFDGIDRAPHMDVLVYLPNDRRGPCPLFLGLNFNGNHTVHRDPGILLSERWMRPQGEGVVDNRATETSRGTAAARYPLETILGRGYALATAYCGDIDPDSPGGFAMGIRGALARADAERSPNAWGSIGAWAWGLQRILDYAETDADVDAQRAIVIGHSRLGKTALWAAAQDERFAMAISNDSGCLGAALSRRRFGETVGMITERFPHWFCENLNAYRDREDDLPVDQHMLIALLAPRPVYVASAEGDRWADPRGEFLGALHAAGIYRLLGTDGLAVEDMPGLNESVTSTIGYHIRPGEHALTASDWQYYLAFADKRLS